jgi:hypothetical protein
MSEKKKECEPSFWAEPSVLFQNLSLQYRPTCEHSMLNFVARLILLSLFLGLIASVIGGLPALLVAVLFGTITAFVIVMTTPILISVPHDNVKKEVQSLKNSKKTADSYYELPYTTTVDPAGPVGVEAPQLSEHFVNGGSAKGSVQPVGEPIGMAEVDASPYSGSSLPDYTPPTSRNLFMNVLLDEIKYNPDRPEAATVGNPTVKQTMDDFFRVQWFSDPTDVFGKNQGQRQFITQPSTTVPNDQGSFADWLYKIPGKTCKEGGRPACIAGSDGVHLPWLNQDA